MDRLNLSILFDKWNQVLKINEMNDCFLNHVFIKTFNGIIFFNRD